MKKIVYSIIVWLLFIFVNIYYSTKFGFDWVCSLVSTALLAWFTYSFFRPSILFTISFWYLDKDFNSCSDDFIIIYQFGIAIAMLVCCIVPLIWQQASNIRA